MSLIFPSGSSGKAIDIEFKEEGFSITASSDDEDFYVVDLSFNDISVYLSFNVELKTFTLLDKTVLFHFVGLGDGYMVSNGSFFESLMLPIPGSFMSADDFYYISDVGQSYFIPYSYLCPDSIPLSSLNGNGCQFSDGEIVLVDTRSELFKTVRSYSIMLSDNSYTACYDLVSLDGLKSLSVPEALLTLYVEPSLSTE